MKTQQVFKTYKERSDEIDKREYENIEGLKAELTEDEYWYFLEVLPPLRFDGTNFYMLEFLTGDLTYYIFKEDGKYFVEVKEMIRTVEEF